MNLQFMVSEMLANDDDDDDDVAMVTEYVAVVMANEFDDDEDFFLVHVRDHVHVRDPGHLAVLCRHPVLECGAVVLSRNRRECDDCQFPFPNRLPLLQSHHLGDHNK